MRTFLLSASSSSSVITLTLESICFHHVVREKVQSAREKKKIKWGEKFVVESISQRIILACHPPQTSLKDRVIVHVQYSQNAWHHKSNCGSWRLVGVLAKWSSFLVVCILNKYWKSRSIYLPPGFQHHIFITESGVILHAVCQPADAAFLLRKLKFGFKKNHGHLIVVVVVETGRGEREK
jgi:hypothetical protein